MSDVHIPHALRSAIEADLRPVRPLATPSRRALALLPLGIVLLIGMPAFWVWFRHITVLAPWPWWSFLAARDCGRIGGPCRRVPGGGARTRVARDCLVALVAVAWTGFLAINLASAVAVDVQSETVVRWIRDCIAMTATFSVPALAIPAWLVSRALPNRPAVTGALCGLGVGLMSDAGLRMLCWNGEQVHVLAAHGGAIAMLMALGAASAVVVERSKAHRSGVA
jgi:hypothetical protein